MPPLSSLYEKKHTTASRHERAVITRSRLPALDLQIRDKSIDGIIRPGQFTKLRETPWESSLGAVIEETGRRGTRWRETRAQSERRSQMRGIRGKNGKQASFLATRRLGFMGLRCPVHHCPGFVLRASSFFPRVVIPSSLFPSFTALFLVLADNPSFVNRRV